MGQSALKTEFEVWVDGSSMDGGRNMGAGWVICNHINHQCQEYSSAIETGHKGSSTIAEAIAAQLALLTIPEGAAVVLHTDCMDVMKILKSQSAPKELTQNTSKARKELYNSLIELFNSMSGRKLTITPVKTNDSDPHLKEAHNLAQEGAMQARSRHNKINLSTNKR